MGILGIGSPFLDYVVQVSDLYMESVGEKGSHQKIEDLSTFKSMLRQLPEQPIPCPGGSCANTIKALAALGHRCKLAGTIGTDEAGGFLRGELIKRGIEEHLQVFPGKTGQLICYVTKDGERTFRNFYGASDEMVHLRVEPDLFDKVSHLHMDGYTILFEGLCERVMEIAKQKGVEVSFDLGSFSILEPRKDLVRTLLKIYVDIVFANDKEAETLTGKPPKEACEELGGLCDTAVVTLGEKGCWVARLGKVEHFPAIPTQVVDTTGAGDLFSAGFLHAHLQGRSTKEAAREGALLASQIIQIIGADLPAESIRKLSQK